MVESGTQFMKNPVPGSCFILVANVNLKAANPFIKFIAKVKSCS